MKSVDNQNKNKALLTSEFSDYGVGGIGCFGMLSLGASKFTNSKIPSFLAMCSLVSATCVAIFLRRQDIQQINDLTEKNLQQEKEIDSLKSSIQTLSQQILETDKKVTELAEENARQKESISSLEAQLTRKKTLAAPPSSQPASQASSPSNAPSKRRFQIQVPVQAPAKQ